jgi:hypothetical protein
MKQRTHLAAKERAVLARESSHDRQIHRTRLAKQLEVGLSAERQLLRKQDQQKSLELQLKSQEKQKVKVIQKQLTDEEHVKRMRAQVEQRSRRRQMSNQELMREKSVAKDRLMEDLGKLYKSSLPYLN